MYKLIKDVKGANEKQFHDLEYMFPQFGFVKSSDNKTKEVTISGQPVEEFVRQLNYVNAFRGERPVAIWGTGGSGNICTENWKTIYPDIDIFCYIDSNESINEFKGKKVFSPEDIELKDYYIVIGNDRFYDEIKSEIKKSGLEEIRDFIGYKTALMDNGKIFLRTFYDSVRTMEFCKRPFGYTDIINDKVYLCCPASMKFDHVGELSELDLGSIWHSVKAKIFRLSIINGSYSFCDPDFCDRCHLNKAEEYVYNNERYTEKEEEFPYDMMIGLDDSCNLHCKSCRNNIWIEKDTNVIERKKKMADMLLYQGGLNSKNLWLAGSGEVFASEVYKHILKDERCINRKQISILTNGVLFNKKNWEEYLEPYDSVHVTFSIDGGTKETYEKLRCGAVFEKVIDNLKFAGELRRSGRIKKLQINYVLQGENIKELAQIREIGLKCSVDRIHVLKMYDYHIRPEEEMEKIIVVDEDKKELKEEYRQFISDDILNDDIFDWSFMTQYLNQKYKESIFESIYSLF